MNRRDAEAQRIALQLFLGLLRNFELTAETRRRRGLLCNWFWGLLRNFLLTSPVAELLRSSLRRRQRAPSRRGLRVARLFVKTRNTKIVASWKFHFSHLLQSVAHRTTHYALRISHIAYRASHISLPLFFFLVMIPHSYSGRLWFGSFFNGLWGSGGIFPNFPIGIFIVGQFRFGFELIHFLLGTEFSP